MFEISSYSYRFILQFPDSECEWCKIAADFEEMWQFPNCVGAVDGKHVAIVPPSNRGSFFYNYKGFHSMVLMAVVNARCEFIRCDFGTNGRVSDGGRMLNNNALKLPLPCKSKCSTHPLPFVFIGGDAFAMRNNILKPFQYGEPIKERKMYKYRLSRARRTVESAFGILASKFRIFHTAINMSVTNIESVVKACCVLHNFIRRSQGIDTLDHNIPDNNHTQDMEAAFTPLDREHGQVSNQANQVRDMFVQYFSGEGTATWQDDMI